MLHMICSGFLWDEAKVGKFPVYDDLVKGWAKWNIKHTDGAGHDVAATDDGDYPHVSFFDTQINPPSLRKLLLKMLNPDPAKRITIAAISAKGWVKNIECCQVDSYEETTTIIDASKAKSCLSKNHTKVVMHNHLPRHKSLGHSLVRMPGSTDM
jgi:protein-serine/threonine kinase